MLGILLGLISAASYGLIPLFTLPLMKEGIPTETLIVYRFAIAAITMYPVMLLLGRPLRINHRDFFKLALLSAVYLFAVISFFHSFRFLPSSIAATIQFLYPVMVMLIMILFFHESFNWMVTLAVLLGLAGVAFLSTGATPDTENPVINSDHIILGVIFSLLAGLGNSLFMVGLQVIRIQNLDGLGITFYVLVFGTFYAIGNALFNSEMTIISQPYNLLLASLLAIVTAVISNLTLVLAIRKIGSTLAAILGVMEPLTAVTVGITIFSEPFTTSLALGIILITSSVFIAILAPKNPPIH